MSSSRRKRQYKRSRTERRFTVRGIRRDQVDMGKLSKALIGLAAAEAERQAQAEHTNAADATKQGATGPSKKPARRAGEAHD